MATIPRMNISVFDDITVQIAQHRQRLALQRTAARTAAARRRRQRVRFDGLVLAVVAVFLTVFALLFDYLAVLNYVLARVDLWVMTAAGAIALSRMLTAWVIVPALHERETVAARDATTRRIAALESYTDGRIDPEGIRALYSSDGFRRREPVAGLTLEEVADWILYTLTLLGLVLFGLIFL